LQLHSIRGKTNNQIDKGDNVLQDIREADPELQCFVCGKKTGCNECEYLAKCEARTFSKYCICKECSKQEDSFHNYQQSIVAK